MIQSIFMRLSGALQPAGEAEALADRIRRLPDNGAAISLTQVYTVARRAAEAFVSSLTADELEQIAAVLRPLGVPVECYA